MPRQTIDSLDVESLHAMRQELLAFDLMYDGDEDKLREIEGALERKGEGVGVA